MRGTRYAAAVDEPIEAQERPRDEPAPRSTHPSTSGPWLIVLRVASLVALATSAALFVDYTSYDPTFCSPGSGCASVRGSGFGYLFNGRIPVPLVGLLGFGFLYVVSLTGPTLRARLLLPIAALGGAVAAVLVAMQGIVIKEFCLYCVVVDVAGLVAAGAAYAHARESQGKPVAELLKPWAWVAVGALVVAAPLLWPRLRPQPEVPKEIRAFYVPGKINVVEFADFQCPFCRMLHPRLLTIIEDYPGQVNFVRLNMPLPRHEQAMDAAKAYVCAKGQGKGEPMADALFEAEDISLRGGRRLAVHLGLDMDAFDACIQNPDTQKSIEREAALLRGTGFQGLPTTYVGGKMIVGAQPEEVFREAFEAAARGEDRRGMPGWLFALLCAVALGAIVFFGRQAAMTPENREAGAKTKASKA